VRYGPGNRILLKAGDRFVDETLHLDGAGMPESPITVTSYGTGAPPSVEPGQGAAHGLLLVGTDHVRIMGIDFRNGVSGILAVSDLQAVQGLEIEDCEFESLHGQSIDARLIMPYPDMYFGAGIVIACYGNASTLGTAQYRDIRIENCRFDDNDCGILTTLNDLPTASDGTPTSAHRFFDTGTIRNIVIRNVRIDRSRRSGGIMLYGCRDGEIDGAVISETGYLHGMYWGVCACQLSMCQDFVVRNSEFMFTRLVNNSPDGEGFDFESGNIDVTLENSYIHDNEGPAILFYGENMGWKGENRGIAVIGCRIENNGTRGRNDHSKVFKNYPANEGIVRDNTIRLAFPGQCFDASPLQFFDNVVLDEAGDPLSGYGRDPDSEPRNLAAGGSATASSSYEYEGFSIDHLLDGERSGLAMDNAGWSSAAGEANRPDEWVLVDLGQVEAISEVHLYAVQRWPDWFVPGVGALFPESLTVRISEDGVSYRIFGTLASIPKDGRERHMVSSGTQNARYVRIEFDSLRRNPLKPEYMARIAEVEIYR